MSCHNRIITLNISVYSWCPVLALPVLDSLLDPRQEPLDPGVDPGGGVRTALAVAHHAQQGVPGRKGRSKETLEQVHPQEEEQEFHTDLPPSATVRGPPLSPWQASVPWVQAHRRLGGNSHCFYTLSTHVVESETPRKSLHLVLEGLRIWGEEETMTFCVFSLSVMCVLRFSNLYLHLFADVFRSLVACLCVYLNNCLLQLALLWLVHRSHGGVCLGASPPRDHRTLAAVVLRGAEQSKN